MRGKKEVNEEKRSYVIVEKTIVSMGQGHMGSIDVSSQNEFVTKSTCQPKGTNPALVWSYLEETNKTQHNTHFHLNVNGSIIQLLGFGPNSCHSKI